MKVQLLTAVAILALSATTAHAGKRSHGTDLTNNSKNALAIGDSQGGAGALGGFSIEKSGGRAIAGSIYLTGGACACDFDDVKNRSRNAIAIGKATAGSIHVDTSMGKPRR